MAVREFRDSTGRDWRAWDIAPDELSPRTKDEDYLAELYHTGWIVFETVAGDDKRRLYPVPKGWSQLPAAELEVLLQKAEIVPPRKLRTEKRAFGDAAAQEVQRALDFTERAVSSPESAHEMARDETPDVTDLGVVRSFRYPGGRIWAVCVVQNIGGSPAVLRFTAGARFIDLVEWPKDWADYQDDDLVELLRRAAPRERRGTPPSGIGPRRWDDQPRM
jgi:hypothetical protein